MNPENCLARFFADRMIPSGEVVTSPPPCFEPHIPD